MSTRYVGAVVLALALAGCGDGGGGGALTKAELISKADAICAKSSKDIDAIPAPESAEDIKEFAPKAAEIGKKQAEDLSKLTPPSELKADWDTAMKQLDEQVALAQKLADAADDQTELQKILADGQKLADESDAIAKKIGLKECGSS